VIATEPIQQIGFLLPRHAPASGVRAVTSLGPAGCRIVVQHGAARQHKVEHRGAQIIRVRIPRDLQDLYAATGRRLEICETLKTSERRGAERRCRKRGVGIDQDLARRRRKRNAASDELSGRRLDLIAQRIYRVELADQDAALHDQMIRDPEMTAVAFDAAAGPLDRGSTGGDLVAEVRPPWQSRQAPVG
jgi:hypothetical protein